MLVSPQRCLSLPDATALWSFYSFSFFYTRLVCSDYMLAIHRLPVVKHRNAVTTRLLSCGCNSVWLRWELKMKSSPLMLACLHEGPCGSHASWLTSDSPLHYDRKKEKTTKRGTDIFILGRDKPFTHSKNSNKIHI